MYRMSYGIDHTQTEMLSHVNRTPDTMRRVSVTSLGLRTDGVNIDSFTFETNLSNSFTTIIIIIISSSSSSSSQYS